MEGTGEPVSPFDSYADLNPMASVTDIPMPPSAHTLQQRADAFSATSAPGRMDGADTMRSDDSLLNNGASPSSTGARLLPDPMERCFWHAAHCDEQDAPEQHEHCDFCI
jgi:hypothetical protein